MSDTIKITLIDQGQEFTEWYVRDGIVIDCQPFQGPFWVGTKITGPIEEGQQLLITTPCGSEATLRYPVESIETLSESEAELVEIYYQGWLKIIGQKKIG